MKRKQFILCAILLCAITGFGCAKQGNGMALQTSAREIPAVATSIGMASDAEMPPSMNKGKEAAEKIPLVMVNGLLYYDTGKESEVQARCGVMDGDISTTVARSQTPTKNGQSNFGTEYSYQYVEVGAIELYKDGKWTVFKLYDPFGITLGCSDVTPTGLTLVCKQSGEKAAGELQTSSLYWLEEEENGEWKQIGAIQEIAWTQEAQLLAKNGETVWQIDWTNLYGVLPNGNYRIGKEIMDFRGTNDYDIQKYYAEFEIADGEDLK